MYSYIKANRLTFSMEAYLPGIPLSIIIRYIGMQNIYQLIYIVLG